MACGGVAAGGASDGDIGVAGAAEVAGGAGAGVAGVEVEASEAMEGSRRFNRRRARVGWPRRVGSASLSSSSARAKCMARASMLYVPSACNLARRPPHRSFA